MQNIIFVLALLNSLFSNAYIKPISPISLSRLSPASFHLKASSQSIENIRESLIVPPDEILNAVDKSNRLTVADCAAYSGSDFLSARRGLTQLASLTGAALEVTNDGEIVYAFPSNFRSVLLQRSSGEKLRRVYQSLLPIVYYIFRISFGVALLTSLAVIFSSIVFISTASSSSENDSSSSRRRNTGSYYSPSFGNTFINTIDIFTYRPYAYYQTSSSNGDLSFIESFFSYIFGDGDPNSSFTQEQTQAAATFIRLNKGVVCAEQLAPYLDPPPLELTIKEQASSSVVSESWVLPLVVRLGGVPTVSEAGDILYAFPELMSSSTDRTMGSAERRDEIKPRFSRANPFNLACAGVLGVVNLLGALYLGSALRGATAFAAASPGVWIALTALQPWLLGYALLYNVLPLYRSLTLPASQNAVDERNRRRREWQEFMLSLENKASTGSTELSMRRRIMSKLQGAKKLVQSSVMGGVIRAGDIVYSSGTKGDVKDGGAGRTEAEALRRFDEKLR